jgi:hypothetical protein
LRLQLNESTFDYVIGGPRPVLVKYWKFDCGNCASFDFTFKKVGRVFRSHKQVVIAAVNLGHDTQRWEEARNTNCTWEKMEDGSEREMCRTTWPTLKFYPARSKTPTWFANGNDVINMSTEDIVRKINQYAGMHVSIREVDAVNDSIKNKAKVSHCFVSHLVRGL